MNLLVNIGVYAETLLERNFQMEGFKRIAVQREKPCSYQDCWSFKELIAYLNNNSIKKLAVLGELGGDCVGEFLRSYNDIWFFYGIMPFHFEGTRKRKKAIQNIQVLKKNAARYTIVESDDVLKSLDPDDGMLALKRKIVKGFISHVNNLDSTL